MTSSRQFVRRLGLGSSASSRKPTFSPAGPAIQDRERAHVSKAESPRDWASFEPFDPNQGHVIRAPEQDGQGYWAGAPGVAVDAETGLFYVVYRIRRPRGVVPDRGAEIRIAKGNDGIHFEDIWTGHKETLGSTSIERCALTRLPHGPWGLYVSYVDPADGRWRIDLVVADDPSEFDLSRRTAILSAADVRAEGIKDPFVFRVAGLFQMIVSFATSDVSASDDQLHGTHDAYNTGLIKSRTGLATSEDGINWQWEGEVFGPSASGWDQYCARIGTVWRQDGIWLALYDGSSDVSENYEERLGLAFSHDLKRFERVTRQEPLMIQPNGSGALRYFDVLSHNGSLYFYYETARADGSHDLRVFVRTNAEGTT